VVESDAADVYSSSTFYFNKFYKPLVDDVRPVKYAKIYLNNKFSWGVFEDAETIQEGVLDVRTCVLHEMGHALLPDLHMTPASVNKYYEENEDGSIFVINSSVSNPILFQIAKQTIIDVYAHRFCSEWAVKPIERDSFSASNP
jgi:hypothetical protein